MRLDHDIYAVVGILYAAIRLEKITQQEVWEFSSYIEIRGDIHTQVATLNVNMTLESETPTPSFNVKCDNKYSFVLKEDKKVIFLS